MSDSRKKWEDMCEEENDYNQYFWRAERLPLEDQKLVRKPSVEQRINELEKRIDKQTELLEEILKTLE